MRSFFSHPASCLAAGILVFWAIPGVAFAQQVRARVVEDLSRSAVTGASVALLSPDSSELAQTTTGPDGFFQLSAPAPGTFLIRIEHLGYETVTRSVAARVGSILIPAFVLRVTAIPLDTLEVEVERSDVTRQGVVGFSRRSYLLSGERMAVLERTGVSFISAVRELGASLRFRSVTVGERSLTCIESTRRVPSFRERGTSRECNMVAIIIDGVNTGLDREAAMRFVHSLHVYEFESMEYLSSVDAGTRYGLLASDQGALVLGTRGRGPYKSEARGGGG